MIAVAFILISAGWLGVYSGFTNRNPRDELRAAFGGLHSQPVDSDIPANPTAGTPAVIHSHVSTK